jgi:DNA-binding response OmpR family regulator
MLPGESGIRVCEKIREEDREVVIVMVTAKDAEEDKVTASRPAPTITLPSRSA